MLFNNQCADVIQQPVCWRYSTTNALILFDNPCADVIQQSVCWCYSTTSVLTLFNNQYIDVIQQSVYYWHYSTTSVLTLFNNQRADVIQQTACWRYSTTSVLTLFNNQYIDVIQQPVYWRYLAICFDVILLVYRCYLTTLSINFVKILLSLPRKWLDFVNSLLTYPSHFSIITTVEILTSLKFH